MSKKETICEYCKLPIRWYQRVWYRNQHLGCQLKEESKLGTLKVHER